MTRHQRDTYIDGHEILVRAVRHLSQIRDILDRARERESSERVRMLLNSMELEQRNLLGAIERYREDAPDKLLNTFAQYTVEVPSDIDPPEEPLTTLSVTQWLLRQNGLLHAMFKELTEKGEKGNDQERRDVWGGIAQQLEAHERRLSKEYQRFEDL
jgi:hypothetical protein